jgi:transcriptional regulator with XRE-family HTH domain
LGGSLVNASNFAGRLKELRQAAGLTQKQLAEKAGMALGGINKLEQGVNRPSWESVLALAEALGVDCRAFERTPAPRPQAGRGRPPKPTGPERARKRPRGRPRKSRER